MVYVHPVAGALILALLAYVALLGLRLRSRKASRSAAAARHARLAPWAYGLTALAWVAGLVSTWLLREDLELAASRHFLAGSLLVALLSASALTSRAMLAGNRTAREIHPWLGAAAALLAAAQFATGLQLTP